MRPFKRRVRLQLTDASGQSLPLLEGVLLGRRAGHYRVAVPQVTVAAGADPHPLEAREVLVPEARVAWIEVV